MLQCALAQLVPHPVLADAIAFFFCQRARVQPGVAGRTYRVQAQSEPRAEEASVSCSYSMAGRIVNPAPLASPRVLPTPQPISTLGLSGCALALLNPKP